MMRKRSRRWPRLNRKAWLQPDVFLPRLQPNAKERANLSMGPYLLWPGNKTRHTLLPKKAADVTRARGAAVAQSIVNSKSRMGGFIRLILSFGFTSSELVSDGWRH